MVCPIMSCNAFRSIFSVMGRLDIWIIDEGTQKGLRGETIFREVGSNLRWNYDSNLLSSICGKAMCTVFVISSAPGQFLPSSVVYKGKYVAVGQLVTGLDVHAATVIVVGKVVMSLSPGWRKAKLSYIPGKSDLHKPIFQFFEGHSFTPNICHS